MDTKQKLDQTLKDALRSNNETQKQVIRMARSSIKNEEVNKGRPLDDAEVVAILQKEIKIRSEAIEGAKKGNRDDLVKANQDEIAVLESFLPQQMSEEEIRRLASAVIADVQASSPSDMGKVMKGLLPQIQGRAPNDKVSQIVRQLLSA